MLEGQGMSDSFDPPYQVMLQFSQSILQSWPNPKAATGHVLHIERSHHTPAPFGASRTSSLDSGGTMAGYPYPLPSSSPGHRLGTGNLTNQLTRCFTQPSSLSLTDLLVHVSLDKMP